MSRPDNIRTHEEVRDDVIRGLGIAFAMCHLAEVQLKRLSDFIFEDKGASYERLVREGVDRRTFGSLVSDMRKLVSLPPEFDDFAYRFVSERNRFIHGVSNRHFWGFSSVEQMQEFYAYLRDIRLQAAAFLQALNPIIQQFGRGELRPVSIDDFGALVDESVISRLASDLTSKTQ